VTPRPIHVRLISRWAVNPYQKLLVEHLQKRGLVISEEEPSIRRLAFRGHPHIVNLQNVRPSLTSAGVLESLVRVLHFTARLLLARLIGIRVVWTAHDLESPSSRHQLIDRLLTAILARCASNDRAQRRRTHPSPPRPASASGVGLAGHCGFDITALRGHSVARRPRSRAPGSRCLCTPASSPLPTKSNSRLVRQAAVAKRVRMA
jgi:hypothetical protein